MTAASRERRARLTRHEHELGEWTRARRAPDPRLSGLLDRELLGYQHSRAAFDSWLEPPRPQLTLMVDLDGALTADGKVLPDAWIGGLDDRPTIVGFGETYASMASGPSPDPAVAWAWRRLCETGDGARRGAGRGDRVQPALPVRGVPSPGGLPPKTVARVLRFHDVRQRIARHPASWGEIAHSAGYADQSHLNREFRDLAGTTPTDFVRRLIPEGGLVGDRSH